MSKFFGGILMAVGLVVAATTGLCSLGFAGWMIYEAAAGNGDWQSMVFVGFWIVLGFVVAAIGWWLFRRGLARLQEE